MGLKGSLREFGIADIIQLIGHQQKSGRLVVRGNGSEISILFHEGRIVGVEPKARKSRDLLGERLVRAGLISEEQLKIALETQKETMQRIGDILVNLGFLSRDDLSQMLYLQAKELLCDVFMWKEGSYEFHHSTVEWDDKNFIPINVEEALIDAFRIIDEWPLIKKRIPSLDIVLRKTSNANEIQDGSISREEAQILNFIDGNRTVERIAELSRMGNFDTCKIIATLMEKGLVEKVVDSYRVEEEGDWKRVRPEISFIFLLILAFFSLVMIKVFSSVGMISHKKPVYTTVQSSDERIMRIRQALEVFYLKKGFYPYHLDELLREGMVDRRDLTLEEGGEYHYILEGGRYRLEVPQEVKKSR